MLYQLVLLTHYQFRLNVDALSTRSLQCPPSSSFQSLLLQIRERGCRVFIGEHAIHVPAGLHANLIAGVLSDWLRGKEIGK